MVKPAIYENSTMNQNIWQNMVLLNHGYSHFDKLSVNGGNAAHGEPAWADDVIIYMNIICIDCHGSPVDGETRKDIYANPMQTEPKDLPLC